MKGFLLSILMLTGIMTFAQSSETIEANYNDTVKVYNGTSTPMAGRLYQFKSLRIDSSAWFKKAVRFDDSVSFGGRVFVPLWLSNDSSNKIASTRFVKQNSYMINSNVATKTNNSDTAAMMAAAPRVQRFLDSVANLKTSIATKQNTLTLTTTGTSGAATLTGATLNIPQYSGTNIYNANGSLTGARTLTLNSQPLIFAGSSTSTRFFSDGNVSIGGTSNLGYKLDVIGGDAQFNNIRVGLGAGGVLTNTALGYQALNTNTIGQSDVAVGYQALKNGNNHQYTVAVGYGALANSASNNANVAVGYNSMGITTAAGQSNTCVGSETGKNLTGGFNSLYGWGSGQNCTNTSENAAFGAYSFYFNSTGTRTAAFGHQSLYRSTGSDNTASGYFSLQSMTSGARNTALGSYAGDKIGTSTSTNTASNNSIFIGYDTRPLGLTQTNQVVIGYGTTGLGDNTTVLGNASTTSAAIAGALAVQTGAISAPVASAQLEVISTTKGFLPPRMTTTQINAISSPAVGLVVYNTTLNVLCVFTGTWQKMTTTTM